MDLEPIILSGEHLRYPNLSSEVSNMIDLMMQKCNGNGLRRDIRLIPSEI